MLIIDSDPDMKERSCNIILGPPPHDQSQLLGKVDKR